MTLNDLPTLNATLNAASTVFLVSGFVCIKLRQVAAHATFMVLALISSAVFLSCYLYYHYHVGHVPFHG